MKIDAKVTGSIWKKHEDSTQIFCIYSNPCAFHIRTLMSSSGRFSVPALWTGVALSAAVRPWPLRCCSAVWRALRCTKSGRPCQTSAALARGNTVITYRAVAGSTSSLYVSLSSKFSASITQEMIGDFSTWVVRPSIDRISSDTVVQTAVSSTTSWLTVG
jgi:hypothetical protein